MTMTQDTARTIARAMGVSPFELRAGDPKFNAQRNLSGRTHYADDDTLRFFSARILATYRIDFDTVFLLVESVAADSRNTRRGFRFVAFDLGGVVVNDRPGTDDLFKSKDAAIKAMWAWADTFDAAAYYRARLVELAARAERDAESLRAAAAVIGAE